MPKRNLTRAGHVSLRDWLHWNEETCGGWKFVEGFLELIEVGRPGVHLAHLTCSRLAGRAALGPTCQVAWELGSARHSRALVV